MLYTVRKFRVQPGRPVKVVFSNPDATDHNLVFVRDGSLEAVGMAANNMARDPANANSDFIPSGMDDQILESSPMIGPTRKSRVHVLRFVAPKEPGIYPYVCTFPGHWVVMKGEMIVASSKEEADRLVADRRPSFVKDWTMADFPAPVPVANDERSIMRGMAAFIDARCHQCHNVGDNATTLGPDLSKISERFQGRKLLQHIVEPSAEINKDYQAVTFVLDTGKVVSGIITSETANDVTIVGNLLAPKQTMTIKKSAIDFREPSRVSSMPQGMLNSLAKEQILDLLAFLQNGGFQLPAYLEEICKPAVK